MQDVFPEFDGDRLLTAVACTLNFTAAVIDSADPGAAQELRRAAELSAAGKIDEVKATVAASALAYANELLGTARNDDGPFAAAVVAEPEAALFWLAGMLTPAQFDVAVALAPEAALAYVSELLTDEQFAAAADVGPDVALEYAGWRLTAAQRTWCETVVADGDAGPWPGRMSGHCRHCDDDCSGSLALEELHVNFSGSGWWVDGQCPACFEARQIARELEEAAEAVKARVHSGADGVPASGRRAIHDSGVAFGLEEASSIALIGL